MKIRDLGDKVEIIESVSEINERYADRGFPEPIVTYILPIYMFGDQSIENHNFPNCGE